MAKVDIKTVTAKCQCFSFLFLLLSLCVSGAQGQKPQQSKPDVERMLVDMSESFRQKAPSDLSLIVQLNVQPNERTWFITIEPGKPISVSAGPNKKAQLIFSSAEETLRLIYEGKMTGLTAAGKAKGAETAPLEMKFGEGVEFTSAVREKLFTFIQHFFNRSIPEKVLLGEEYSRMVHGGHAIPPLLSSRNA